MIIVIEMAALLYVVLFVVFSNPTVVFVQSFSSPIIGSTSKLNGYQIATEIVPTTSTAAAAVSSVCRSVGKVVVPTISSTCVPSIPTASPVSVITCSAEIDLIWRIKWPKTICDNFAFSPCLPQFTGHAERLCSCKNNGLWGLPNLNNCHSKNFDGLSSLAHTFFQNQPDVSGALYLMRELRNMTKPGREEQLLPNDLNTLNYIVKETLVVLRRLRRQRGQERDQGTDILDTMNDALDPDNKDSWLELQDSDSAGSEELLSNAESYALYLASTINNTDETTQFSRENLVLRAKRFSRSNGVFRNSKFPSESDLVNSSNSDITNSITIPAAYLEARANDSTANGEVSVVNMLFPSLKDFLPSANNETIPSVIISSQVITNDNQTTSEDTSIESVLLESPIELTFALDLSNVTYNTSIGYLIVNCVYWRYSDDFNSTSEGSWVRLVGTIIRTDDLTNETVIRCHSHHLTSFTVLIEVIDSVGVTFHSSYIAILPIISYIGCSLSIVCLFISIICLLTLKKELLQKPVNLIHLNLSIALMIGLLLFLCGLQAVGSIPELCTTITVLTHYFLLAAFSWMFCEALMLYLLVVIVFSRLTNKWWMYLLIGWGLPVIPVVIALAVRFNDYRNENFCWLNPKHGITWSFVGPVVGVICINTVVLVVVLIRIGRTSFQKKKRQSVKKRVNENPKKSHSINQRTAINIVKGMILLLPLLGPTWIIGIFVFNENTVVFAYLSAIINSLQGVFIFFFHIFKGPLILGRFKTWWERNKRKRKISVRVST